MKRKTFIKKMMGRYGLSHNQATEIAKCFREGRGAEGFVKAWVYTVANGLGIKAQNVAIEIVNSGAQIGHNEEENYV